MPDVFVLLVITHQVPILLHTDNPNNANNVEGNSSESGIAEYVTVSNDDGLITATMRPAIQVHGDINKNLFDDDSQFEHLTMSKSGRVKKKPMARSPTFLRATHIGKANTGENMLLAFTSDSQRRLQVRYLAAPVNA